MKGHLRKLTEGLTVENTMVEKQHFIMNSDLATVGKYQNCTEYIQVFLTDIDKPHFKGQASREDSKKTVRRNQVIERVVSDTEEKMSGVPEKTFGVS